MKTINDKNSDKPGNIFGSNVVRFVVYLGSFMVVGWLLLAVFLWLVGVMDAYTAPGLVTGVVFVLYTWAFFHFTTSKVKKWEEQDYLPSQRKKVRSKDGLTRAGVALAWPLAGVIGVPVTAGLLQMLARLLGLNLEGFAGGLIWVAALVLMFVVYVSFTGRKMQHKPTGRVVLWLRRFHEDGFFPFDLLLEDSCRGIALPLTVADTTVPGSDLAGQAHPLVMVGVFTSFLAFGGGFMAMGEYPMSLVVMIALPLMVVGIGLMGIGKKLGGRSDLRTDEGQKVIRDIFDAIDQQQPLSANLTVVRMSDENWKEWVGDFIERADAVIMDITHLTDSLGWELNACRENVAPKGMILACGHYDDTEEDPWPALEPKLEQYLGAAFLADCQRFTYKRPRKDESFGRKLSGNKWTQQFSAHRQRLALRLRRDYEAPLLACFSEAFKETPKMKVSESK